MDNNYSGNLSSLVVKDKKTLESKTYLLQDARLTEKVTTLTEKVAVVNEKVTTLETTPVEVQVRYIPNGEIEEICQ